MSEQSYPDESSEYREARDELLEEEKALVEKVRLVAEKRRQLPLGGRLKEDYKFQWANDDKVGQEVTLSELFGDKPTLLLYNFMYGPNWDNPCLSCTSLMDGFDRSAYQVTQNAAFCGIAEAPAEKIKSWAKTRGWTQIDLVSGFGTTRRIWFQARFHIGSGGFSCRPGQHLGFSYAGCEQRWRSLSNRLFDHGFLSCVSSADG